MSAAELHVLSARLCGGIIDKARRGELSCFLRSASSPRRGIDFDHPIVLGLPTRSTSKISMGSSSASVVKKRERDLDASCSCALRRNELPPAHERYYILKGMSPHLVFATALFTIAFVVGCKSQRSSSMIFDAGPRPTVTSAGPVSLAPPLPPAPLPTLLVFESTEALIKKPWTRSLVERLARQTEIAGERVGIRGGPSVEYPL